MTPAEAEAQLNAALTALEDHWKKCCCASSAHYLDGDTHCEAGKALYRDFEKAERQWRIASWGNALPFGATGGNA